jgi:hypothetical protein
MPEQWLQQLVQPGKGKLRFGLHSDGGQRSRAQDSRPVAPSLQKRGLPDPRLASEEQCPSTVRELFDDRVNKLRLGVPADQSVRRVFQD